MYATIRSTILKTVAVSIIGALLAACSPTSAIDLIREGVQAQVSQPTTEPEQPRPTAPPGAKNRAERDNPTQEQAKISVTIARGNFEQEQAFGSKDPSVMRGSSTDRHFRQMAQTNQELMDSNVTAIKLIGIEWGTTTVRGNAAIATTWETWSTTYANGETRQSRDRNEYSLVLQSGTWKIDGNYHPDNSAPSVPPGSRQV